jgi:hypothetical protein
MTTFLVYKLSNFLHTRQLVTHRIVCNVMIVFFVVANLIHVGQRGKDQNKEPMKKKMKQTYVPCRFVA